MNILILEREEIGTRLPRSDRRYEHVKKVLKKKAGDRLAAGVADGETGEALVREIDEGGLVLDFAASLDPAGAPLAPPPLAPIRLILGFPRPIQANRILKDLTSLGVEEIHLTGTELGEKSYAQSSIFKDKDFRAALIEGAEQACNPRLPRVITHWSLKRCLEAVTGTAAGATDTAGARICLHPYGDPPLLGALEGLEPPLILAIGSERGWTQAELELLEAAGFEQRGLGARILKTETAAIAAVSIALAKLGRL